MVQKTKKYNIIIIGIVLLLILFILARNIFLTEYYIGGPTSSVFMNYQNLNTNENESQSLNAPLLFKQQLYPRTPFIVNEGSNCKDGCGAMGTCINNKCALKSYNKTVFDIEI